MKCRIHLTHLIASLANNHYLRIKCSICTMTKKSSWWKWNQNVLLKRNKSGVFSCFPVLFVSINILFSQCKHYVTIYSPAHSLDVTQMCSLSSLTIVTELLWKSLTISTPTLARWSKTTMCLSSAMYHVFKIINCLKKISRKLVFKNFWIQKSSTKVEG